MFRFAVPTFASAGFRLLGAAAIAIVSWSPILPLGPFFAAAVVGVAAAAVVAVAPATVVGAAVVGATVVGVAFFFVVGFFEAAGDADADVTARLAASSARATPRRRVDSLDMVFSWVSG
jgi:hypothetical protein